MTDWAVPHASKVKYSQIFNSNDNQRSGLLSGAQARNILIQSGLSQQILAQIWFLSDCDKDGMLTCEEFILAMHLIDRVKAGFALPTVLPPELLPPAIKRKLSLVSPTLSVDKTKDAKPIVPSQPSIAVKPEIPPAPVLVEWNIPQASKLKYTQLFNQVDTGRSGFLTGIQARNILLKSGLSNQHLASIWNLSDIDKDGNLTCEEFILSMHLIDMVKAGDPLPLTLPLDLIPLNYRKKLSINGPAAVVAASTPPTLVNQSSIESIGNRNTFEDKRKENFEKGQAELEKRRQLLLDQQRREQEERERKEKEEFEKRERIRLEQERKKKEEIERQLQKQREIEMQKEEERKKQQELKEAARREMERQRMIEWENRKKSEMQASKERVQEILISLKAKKQRMVVDVEQVNAQLNGLKEKVEETRSKVAEAKQEIDKMRITRDAKLKEMNALKQQIRSLLERQLIIEQEKLSLSAQLKNLNIVDNNNITDSADFALKSKQIRIEQLKQQLVEYEKEKEIKEKDIEEHRAELEKYKMAYEEVEARANELQRVYDDKRKEALEVIEKSIKLAEEASKYALDLNAGWGSVAEEPQQKQPPIESFSASGALRYRALYDFEGTNPDDLSFSAGDIINAVGEMQPDQDWLQGELNGKVGWFPRNFSEPIAGDGSVNVPSSVNETAAAAVSVNSSLGETYAEVLYDWNGTDPENHLSIKKDDKVKIVDTNEDWLFGELNGKSGWLPKSYVNYGDSTAQATEWYISTFAFETQEPGDLAFNANELIRVTKTEGEWWTGEISEERKGIFPNTFVRPATEEEIAAAGKIASKPKQEPSAAPVKEATTGNWSESVEHTPSRSSDTSKSKKSKTKKPEIVCAIANYKPTSKEQLELKKGQMIQVRKKLESGWLLGEIQVKGQKKQTGYFPASYVKSIGKSSGDDSQSAAPPKSPQIIKEEKAERVVALYPYTATQDDELSFEANEVLKVLSKEDATWWKGESESTGKEGLFPSNYCQPYSACHQSGQFNTADRVSKAQLDFDESVFKYAESIGTSNMEFDNSSFDNSSFYTDDEEEEDFDSFFTNRSSSDQQVGSRNDLFNHLNDPIDRTKTYAFIESTSVPATNSHLIKKELTKEEILFKREQNIQELIQTEQDYVKDVKIVIDVYQDQILRSPYLHKQLAAIIFLNWESLLECNQRFLDELLKRKYEYQGKPIDRIGDILTFYFKNKICDKYTKFCSNQMKSMKVFEQEMQTNHEFKNQIMLCNELNKDKLKLQDFTSFILKPMQRITRYILLVKAILKHTPIDHADHQQCTEAFREAENLCELVNQSCQSAENEERLDWIQRSVKCSGIDQRIKYNSITKFCGMRTLVFYGRLVNDTKNKPLLGLLFNDFFLLVKNLDKQKRIQKYANLFICKEALGSKYKVYKRPFLLDDVEVILSAHQVNDDDSAPNLICMLNKKGEFRPNLKFFCIKIHSLKKYFFLRAFNGHDRKQWIHRLNESIQNYVSKKSFYYEKSLNNLMQNFDCNEKIGNLSLIVIRLNNFKTRNYVLNAFCAVSIGSNQIVQEDHDHQFKSKVAKFKSNQYSLCDAVFNFSAKFPLSRQMIDNDFLTIACIEESPFAPDCMIGKAEISLRHLINRELSLAPNQTIHKTIKFETFTNSSHMQVSPVCVLQIKYKTNNN